MERLLDFPDEVPLTAANTCPLSYPSERDPRTARAYVLPARAAHERGTRVSVPVKEFAEVQSFLDAVAAAVPTESIGVLRELQQQMLQARGDILDEMRSVISDYAESTTEYDWAKSFQRVTERQKIAFDRVRNRVYAATEVVVLTEDEYRAAVAKWAAADSAPTGQAAASFRRQAVRQTVARAVANLKDAIEVGQEKLATLRKLEAAGKAVMVIEVGVDMYRLLAAKDVDEYRKAVVNLVKNGASLVGGGAGAAAGPALVGLISATPAGWVVVGVSIAASVTMGWFIGGEAEKLAAEFFRNAGFPEPALP